ncbi:MAG: MBL fold metallo-hydrolase [Chloroflexota bacterium]
MTQSMIQLPEVDDVVVTTIVDNSIDLGMASTDLARRLPMSTKLLQNGLPVAEHGLSLLIEVKRGDRVGTILFDTGASPTGLLHNLDVLQVHAQDVQAIVLSHGHWDHAMGLAGLVDRLGPRRLPLVIHPDAYLERKLVLPNGTEVEIPTPLLSDFRRENVEIIEEIGPSMLLDGMALVTGEVARTTDFEIGFPVQWAKRHGTWEHDPVVHDDQGLIVNLKEKGLVVITGCGHAGIINTIRHAQAITGNSRVYAVIGGFHLAGRTFEPLIPATVAALDAIAPGVLVPTHCTGWRAIHAIARAMPDAFIANSVGTVIQLT